ncbi:MAG: peptide ABC transporter substrate-binding protein [Cytophagales bacterium]|nr:peptide ABC transporter substrate-binding protein [Armatimonadota bacterium]
MPRFHPFLSRTRAVASLLLAAGFASLIATGCGDPGGKGGGVQTAKGTGASGGILRYPIETEPTTLDPAVVQDGPTIDLLQNLYEGLVGWNDKNEVVPLIAEDLPKISADGKTYTFTIRDNAKFFSGDPVTAEDVKYSITRSLDKRTASPVALNYLDDIVGARDVADGKTQDLAGVKALDPRTVQITLAAPRGYFLGKLTYPTAYVLSRKEVEKGPTNAGGIHTIDASNAGSVGCGPFRLASYVRGSKITLSANADYWNGKPKLEGIERPIILDVQTQRNLYDSGRLDYIVLQKGDFEKDRSNPALQDQIKKWKRAATWYVGLNQTYYKPFADKRVRQAFAHAVDKDAIVKSVLLAVPQKAEGILPDGIPGYSKEFKGLPYDPEKAKTLLAAAGYPGGKGLPPLQITFRQKQSDVVHTAEVLQEQLAKVGIPVTLNAMEWGSYLNLNNNNKTDLFHMRWSADYLDPQDFLSLLLTTTGTENHTGYSNKQVDALCEQADRETDQKKRLALYQQAEKLVVEDAPWIPIYYQVDLELMRPSVQGVRDGLMGHLPHTTTTVN